MIPPLASPTAATAWLALGLLLSSPPQPSSPAILLPVKEVVKVYGKLAGATCFGRTAPSGSSCQITKAELKSELGFSPDNQRLSKKEFTDRLQELPFQWPLKPYGVDKSLDKTALLNKGAETRLYMEQLEGSGLYDRRNPTGPLPTSLRPQLNAILQREGLQAATVDRVFDAMASRRTENSSSGDRYLTAEVVDNLFGNRDALDYFEFLEMLGTDSISWQ